MRDLKSKIKLYAGKLCASKWKLLLIIQQAVAAFKQF